MRIVKTLVFLTLCIPFSVLGNQYQAVHNENILLLENLIYDMDICIQSLELDSNASATEEACAVYGDLVKNPDKYKNTIRNISDSTNDAYYAAVKSKKLNEVEHLKLKDLQSYLAYLMDAFVNRLDQVSAITSINDSKK